MTHHEPDVLAVRALADEPTDESVTRSWYRITQLEAKRHTISRRRFLVPVAAGAAIVVLAGTSLSLTRDGDDGGQYLSGTHVEIVSALDALVAAAEQTAPLSIPDGKLIYTEIDGWAAILNGGGTTGEMKEQPREIWFEPNGGFALKLNADGFDLFSGQRSNPDEIAQHRQELATEGPGVRRPTLAWLAGLPADPAQLLAALRHSTGTHDKWSVDQQLWDAMGGLYTSHEIALSPSGRAALLRSYKGIEGLKAREITLDGRSLIAIRFIEGKSGDEILFDPLSGRAVGRSSLYFGELQLTQPSNAPVIEPNVTYVATWTQQIVDPL